MAVLHCDFCAHRCALEEGQRGLCGIRENQGGELVTTVYGQVQSAAVDPIEKKPLYHFLPGSRVFSVALAGCNFRCSFCQNASIAVPELFPPPAAQWRPEDVVDAWERSETPTVAYTYSEPSVWQDFILDTAPEIRRRGGKVVMVTNGFLTPQALERLLPVVDAFNIDLKGDDHFYRSLCRGTVAPVLDTIRRVSGVRHLEVTTMLIPSRHTPTVVSGLRRHLVDAGVKVWHLSRFFPAWKMRDEPATSEEFLNGTIEEIRNSEAPPFIFAGNSRQSQYQRTHCPECGTLCIDHRSPVRDFTHYGACPHCGYSIYGVFG